MFSKMKTLLLVFAFALILSFELVHGAHPPAYMKLCSKSDPKFDDCVFKSAKAALKKFSEGDEETGVPVLDPLTQKELVVFGQKGGKGLNMFLEDCILRGLGTFRIERFKIDLKKKKCTGKMIGDFITEAKYNLVGTLLSFPLHGSGNSYCVANDTHVEFVINFDIVKHKNDGKNYLKILGAAVKFEVGHAEFRVDKLLNDKILSDRLIQILNDLWPEVVTEMSPPIAKVIQEYLRQSTQNFFDSVPMDELFLP